MKDYILFILNIIGYIVVYKIDKWLSKYWDE